eukprot:11645668-Prorocentrum_lima.AAC.1
MTSSLVGSEMCIRDRDKHEGGSEKQCSSGPGCQRTSVYRRSYGSLIWSCLLYTSDAADDM